MGTPKWGAIRISGPRVISVYARSALKPPWVKSMVVCIHSGPSLKAAHMAIEGVLDTTGRVVVFYQLYLRVG